jgi:hypothetical protein
VRLPSLADSFGDVDRKETSISGIFRETKVDIIRDNFSDLDFQETTHGYVGKSLGTFIIYWTARNMTWFPAPFFPCLSCPVSMLQSNVSPETMFLYYFLIEKR